MTGIRHFTASAVVLDNSNRILLVHHNKINLWVYPGGHVDENEDPAQAAVREVLEETGIQVTIVVGPAFSHRSVHSHPAPWAIIEMDVTDSKIGDHRHIDFVYVCWAIGGEPIAQTGEISAARWVPLADVISLPTPAELPELLTAAAAWANRTSPAGTKLCS